MTNEATKTHHGSCHCGATKFEVDLDASKGGNQCNCSICAKLATYTTPVKPAAFRLLSDEKGLTMYEWGGRTGQRYFCSTCGVQCFGRGYLEQLGGAYVSVNLNALDDLELGEMPRGHWDGRHDNWMAGTRKEPWPMYRSTPAP